MYRGTPMRSRLEATFAARLDEMRLEWLYEPMAYADGRQQYLPDFMLPHVQSPLSEPGYGWGAQSLFFDVKGPDLAPAHLVALQERMYAILASEPAAQLAIVTDSMMREGRFLIRQSPAPGTLPVASWEYGAWAECHCGAYSPVVLRQDAALGRCPECNRSVWTHAETPRRPSAA